MLEGLELIDWAKLEHAYGPAVDTPGVIRALASTDPDVRHNAMHELYSTIYHQGSFYSATAAAVPFLIELLNCKSADLEELLSFLALLGQSRMELRREVGLAEKEIQAVRATVQAVQTGVPAYLRLLESSRLELACGAAAVLACCGPEPIEAMRRRYAVGDDELIQVVILLAVGQMARGTDLLFEEAAESFSPRVRLAGALGNAFAAGPDLSKADLREMVKLLKISGLFEQLLDLMAESSVGNCLALDLYFFRLPPALREPLIDSLSILLEKATDPLIACGLAEYLLETVFPEPIGKGFTLYTLTESQRMVLESMARSEIVWLLEEEIYRFLKRAGFKARWNRERWRSFLEIPSEVHVLILTPQNSAGAVDLCQRLNRTPWIHAPWLFFKLDTSALTAEIVENPEDYTPAVMQEAREIADHIYQDVVYDFAPELNRFRFYPQVSVGELQAICKRLGWQILSPPEDAVFQPAPGMEFSELTEEQRRVLERFVERMDAAGWRESRRWYEFFCNSAGMKVSPVGFGRWFTATTLLEGALWFYDEVWARQTGQRMGLPYLKLMIVKPDSPQAVTLRFYFGKQLDAVLDGWFASQSVVTRDNFAEVLIPALLPVCERVALELDDGGLAVISR